jgi:hypothetical protein
MRHVTVAEIESIKGGTASVEMAASVGEHVRHCAGCAAKMQTALSLGETAALFRAALTIEEESEHLDDDQIEAMAATSLPAAEQHRAAAHLAECRECRDDVADLRRWILHSKRRSQRRSAVTYVAAAAAVAAVGFLGLAVLREREQPAVENPPSKVVTASRVEVPVAAGKDAPTLRPEWRELIRQVRATRRLPFPADLRELARGDRFRGNGGQQYTVSVFPSATAVDDVRPELRWSDVAGGRYIVTVMVGTEVVARSEALTAPRWRTPVPLERGVLHRWQIEVIRGDERFAIPAPPSPPAAFRVVGQREHAELEAAKREAPDDHLLRGILYARAGMVDEARRELEQWSRVSGDREATDLLTQLPRLPDQ